MGSRIAQLSRGRSLARFLAGVTLPLPGGGSGVKLLLKSVSLPQGPDNGVLLANNTTFLPNAQGYSDGTSKLYWEMDMPSVSTINNVRVFFLDTDGNGFAMVFRPSGQDQGFIPHMVSGGVLGTTYNTIVRGLTGTLTGSKAQLFYNGATGVVEIRRDGELLGSQTGMPTGRTFIRYTNFSGFGRTPISGVRYGATSTPLLVSAAVPSTVYAAEVDFDYTNTSVQADVPNIQLYYADGVTLYGAKHQAILVDNTTAGKAKVRSALTYTASQNSTKPQFKLFEVINGVETGNTAIGSITMPSRAATFGANLSPFSRFGPLRTYADLYHVGITKDTTQAGYPQLSNGVAGKTDANGWPLDVGVQRQIGTPDAGGQTCIITWDGTGNSVNRLVPSEGNMVISGLTSLGPNSASYVPTFVRDGVGGNAIAELRFNIGSVPPTNIKIYSQGEDRTKYWADSYIAFADKNSAFSGAMRVMDQRNINGNGNRDITWAMRTLPDDLNVGVDGESIERVIELCNLTGRDLWLPVPGYADNDYITQLSIAINTGSNLSQGKPWSSGLLPGLNWYFERANEVWNVQFPSYQYDRTRYAARTGETRLGDSNGGTEQSYKEHAFQYDRMVTAMMAAIPNYADRVVRVFATQRAPLMYNIALQAGLGSKIDALSMAPYFPVAPYAVQINQTGKTPTEIEPFMAMSIDNVMSQLTPYAASAKSNGHRFICYEAGMDWADSNDPSATGPNNPVSPNFNSAKPMYMTGAEIYAFRTSPSFYRCCYRYFNAWKTQFGDEMNQYRDIGETGGIFQWGLKTYQGAPGPYYGIEALQDVIAGLPPRY